MSGADGIWRPEPHISPEKALELIERGEADPEVSPEIKKLIAEADAEDDSWSRYALPKLEEACFFAKKSIAVKPENQE